MKSEKESEEVAFKDRLYFEVGSVSFFHVEFNSHARSFLSPIYFHTHTHIYTHATHTHTNDTHRHRHTQHIAVKF